MGDPYKLISERDPDKFVWACGLCNRACTGEAHARSCCMCPCGKPSRKLHYIRCEECEAAEQQRLTTERHVRELKLIAAATLVDLADYDGDMVSTTWYGEEGSYHYSTEEILDHEDEPLAWAWACAETNLSIGTFDARDLVAGVTEEWFEDAPDHFDLDALQKVLDDWCTSQSKVHCWHADSTRIVVLCAERRAEVEAMVKEAAEFVAERDGHA